MSDTPKVYAAIAAVQADFSKMGLAKDEENAFQKYSFRGIDALMKALSPLLVKHGLLIHPKGKNHSIQEGKSKDGKAVFHVVVEMDYVFLPKDGPDTAKEVVNVGPFYGEALDTSDKATNKAMSFAYKYMALQTFCIPVAGQDEGDKDHNEVEPQGAAPSTRPDPAEKQLPQGDGKPVTPPAPEGGTISELLEQTIGFGKYKGSFWYDVLDDTEMREYMHWIVGNAAKQLKEDDKPIGDNAKNAARVIAHHEALKADEL